MPSRSVSVLFLIVALSLGAAAQSGGWYWCHEAVAPPDVRLGVRSVSFSPFTRDQNPTTGSLPSIDSITRDIEMIKHVTGGIRTYAVTAGLDKVAEVAFQHRLFRVALGAWIDKDEQRNHTELESVIQLANSNKSVTSVLVGNEAVLRGDKTAAEMADLIRRVKRYVHQPVSTGEVWHVWIKNPDLAKAADYLAVHILPYWEGVPADKAVEYTFMRYDELRQAYPGKKIVIAEFGWPSAGYNRNAAETGPLIQAQVVRTFIAEANRRRIDYNLVEAFDQPWKTAEGSVGAYWGLFDADRKIKFDLAGPVEESGDWAKAEAALVLGTLIGLVGLARRRASFGHALAFTLAANAFAAGLVVAAVWPLENYMNSGTWLMWSVGLVALLPLTMITLAKVHEVAEVILGHRPQRLLVPGTNGTAAALASSSTTHLPKVSIQIPAYRERPEMLITTLDAVAALDYPDFEALVIINNTPEESYWRPIEAHCQKLGERFKFVFLPKVSGFKAGALNLAMTQVDPAAEILALIDADYVVAPNWLKDLVPAFANPKVALVQAPQDHRDGGDSLLKRMMNWEYAGFFDIGMIQRNEDDAIVAHGTMLLVRRSAFEQVGGWQTDTIVEDTELGLRLYEAGYSAQYTNTRYGWGVLPDTFKAFKTQRHRWAYGAVQIIKKHWRHMLPGQSTLTTAQKFQFTTGWFYWLSDALGALIAVLNLLWVPVILWVGVTVPTVAMTVPILTAFVVNIAHCVLLYRARVHARWGDIAAAAVAAMSLQLTVAQAVFDGLIKDGLPFMRTEKGGNSAKRKKVEPVVLWETLLALPLLAAAYTLWWTNGDQVVEINFFAATLAIQAIPFLAALVMRAVEKVGES
ncbi:Glycosyltransferase [uncultured Gammaproteobacteria bacterium]